MNIFESLWLVYFSPVGLTYEDQQAYIVGLTEDQRAFTIYIHIPPPGPIPLWYGASTYIYIYILAIF